jgi:hypothetical protein
MRPEIVQPNGLVRDVHGGGIRAAKTPLAPHRLQARVLRPNVIRNPDPVPAREFIEARQKKIVAVVGSEQLSKALARDDTHWMPICELRYSRKEGVKNPRTALESQVCPNELAGVHSAGRVLLDTQTLVLLAREKAVPDDHQADSHS